MCMSGLFCHCAYSIMILCMRESMWAYALATGCEFEGCLDYDDIIIWYITIKTHNGPRLETKHQFISSTIWRWQSHLHAFNLFIISNCSSSPIVTKWFQRFSIALFPNTTFFFLSFLFSRFLTFLFPLQCFPFPFFQRSSWNAISENHKKPHHDLTALVKTSFFGCSDPSGS